MNRAVEAEKAIQHQALARYAVLDTPPDPAFDDLAELARALTEAAASGIVFFDGERVWFKSAVGVDVQECRQDEFPVRWGSDTAPSLAGPRGTGVLTGAARFSLGGQDFSSWAAAPLVTGDGYLLGGLFVLDGASGLAALPEQTLAGLAALARQAQAGLELRRTRLSYRAVVDGIGNVVFQTDEEHRLVSITPTWTRMTHFGVVRSLGRPLVEFVHDSDREHVDRQLLDLQERWSTAATFECRLRRLLGDDVPVEVIARPLVDEAGRRRGLVGVIADITERKARAIEAQHAQKLEALGRVSAGLAHEINSPIQFIGDNTRFLADAYRSLSGILDTYREIFERRSGELDGTGDTAGCGQCRELVERAGAEADIDFVLEEVPVAIQQSLEGLTRVATLVRAMRTFSHPGQNRQTPTDLNEALAAAVTVARNQVTKVADIDCQFDPLPPVTCSIGDLNQVFLNLVVNAADAIADSGQRGTLTVVTRLEGDDAVVTVSDTGIGIPDDIKLRIFEPFFTTKEVGHGAGQGLALARAVVHDKHGGRIDVTSQVGRGSTFTIRLPVAGRPPTA
jgi:PAS domain S-box-containing protein